MTDWRATRFWCALVSGLVLAAPAVAEGPAVRGIVLDGNGKPVAKASVELVRVEGELEWGRRILAGKLTPTAISKTASQTDGTFVLHAPASGFYSLIVRAGGFVPMEWVLDPLVEDAWVAELRLRPDVGLSVHVADVRGNSVPLALVRVRSVRRSSKPATRAEWTECERLAFTVKDGLAHLARASGERLDLSARATAAAASELAGEYLAVRPGTASVELTVRAALPRWFSVKGSQGESLAGTLVLDEHAQLPLAMTGADGRAQTALVEGRDLALRFVAPGHVSFELDAREPARPPAGGAPPAPQVVRLASRTSVSGRVLETGSRAPIAGAVVWQLDRPEDSVITDGRGRYVLAVNEGPAIGVTAKGHLSTLSMSAALGAEGRTFLLRPTVEVEGTVVDESKHPVRDADVTLGRQMPTTRSDAAGRFRLSGLLAEGGYKLRVNHAGYAPAAAILELAPSKASFLPVAITLALGYSARLHVADTSGRALPGAKATLDVNSREMRRDRLRAAPERPLETRSDARGIASWDHLGPGSYDIAIEAKGFAPLRLPGVSVDHPKPSATSIDFGTVRLSPGAALDGVVVDLSGAPLAEVEVRSSNTDFAVEGEAVTDAEGNFRIEDLVAGKPVDILAQRPGWSDTRMRRVAVPSETRVRMVMAPTVHVRGRVLDAESKALPGVGLSLEQDEGGPSARLASEREVKSDSNGEFAFSDVSAGTYSLFAWLSGFQTGEQYDIRVLPGKDLDGLEIVLRPGSVVFGTVFDADGAPVSDAWVTESRDRGASGMIAPSDETDGDGHYLLTAVAPGHKTIAARSQKLGSAAQELDVKPGENELDLHFRGGVDVSGSVLGEHGALANARVAFYAVGGGEPKNGTSDAEGHFAFNGVRDGQYKLLATLDGYAPATPQSVTVAGAPLAGLEIRLARGGRIVGELRGLGLNEVNEVHINAFAVGNPGSWRDATIDATGHYRVDDVAPGIWMVSGALRSGHRASGRVTVPDPPLETTLDLDFAKGLVLSGHVVRRGAPLPDATAIASGRTVTGGASGVTDADGRFRIEGLDPGTYGLSVIGRGSAWSQSIDLEENRDLEIALEAGGVQGHVLDASDGSPIPGATLSLVSANDDLATYRGAESASATSDSRGAFRVADVSTGSWTLSAELDGYASAKTAVAVEDGKDTEAELRMQRTDGLVVEVTTPTGPPGSVRATIVNSAGTVVASGGFQATDTGRVRFERVPPGTYEVLLTASGSAVADFSAVAPGPATPVRLQPGAQLVIHVADLEANTTPAKASLSSAGRNFRAPGWDEVLSTWSLSYGKATVTSVPPGSWTVQVTAADGRVWSGTVTAFAGVETPVELR